jgi:hypothetical protein
MVETLQTEASAVVGNVLNSLFCAVKYNTTGYGLHTQGSIPDKDLSSRRALGFIKLLYCKVLVESKPSAE